MFDFDKKIKNMIGNTKRGGRNDWDGDGVRNKKDCQPRNTMRQDDSPYSSSEGQQILQEEFNRRKRLYPNKSNAQIIAEMTQERNQYKNENNILNII